MHEFEQLTVRISTAAQLLHRLDQFCELASEVSDLKRHRSHLGRFLRNSGYINRQVTFQCPVSMQILARHVTSRPFVFAYAVPRWHRRTGAIFRNSFSHRSDNGLANRRMHH